MFTFWMAEHFLVRYTWKIVINLLKELLPAIRSIANEVYIFQQDSPLAHLARQTVELLHLEKLKSISPDMWPPSSPD